MAPRTAKAKKAVDVKVADSEAPKKGRGKAKVIEDPEPEVLDSEVSEEVAAATDKKSKRGKKVANGQDNDKSEDSAPPAKKGRKKVAEETNDDKPNDDNSADEESTPSEQNLENGDSSEANGDAMEVQNGNAKGRKKPAKKESAAEVKPKQTGRGRKNAKPAETEADQEVVDEKPKSAGKGRGRKAPAKSEPESQEKSEDNEEEPKPEPAPAKGRKKAQPKAVKEKTPESEKEEVEAENMEVEDEQPEEPKKKESKGRKNQGKKAQAKEESVEKDEDKEEPPAKKRKGAKKDEKAKGDVKEEEATDDVEEKPAKGKRGQKKVAEPSAEADEEPQDTGEQPTKRRRKQAEEKAPAADKKKAPLKNKAATDYEELDFSNSSQNTQGKEWNFKISSWNVDGIRAWMNKGGLDYIKYEKPDILCLQEVKCAQDKLPEEVASVPGYHAYWLCSDKDGYAGVGIYTAKLAMNVQYGLQNEELDSEGRVITAEYEHFYLITTYVPNAGRKLVTLPKRLQWNEEFRKYVKELDKKKPVIICGDMNVAHNEIDLANPKTNRKNAGFTDEERSGMSELLGDGFVDTYRHLNPDKTGAYTFWTYMMNSRSKNVGWRLDYFIVSERLLPSLCDSVIRDGVYGSDHCPISLFLHLSSADKPK
ncbi:DNA-(apurinic or apyrimidinic site) lyase [Ostrinia furnacalis]|uniref:DNA-(apurinic or apyrimidinic site) lyase n=1 Tax=Ostrinia furnacalis TaxID=93504 RepID=UPI00103B338E|nr:DNA-(apurinic or apyrimidinic site) lyase [Ostrinia furnacalis]